MLDLSEITFMDSTGLSAMLVAEMHARMRGQRFSVVEGPPHVNELFRLTGVDNFLEIVSRPDAPRKDADRAAGSSRRASASLKPSQVHLDRAILDLVVPARHPGQLRLAEAVAAFGMLPAPRGPAPTSAGTPPLTSVT